MHTTPSGRATCNTRSLESTPCLTVTFGNFLGNAMERVALFVSVRELNYFECVGISQPCKELGKLWVLFVSFLSVLRAVNSSR